MTNNYTISASSASMLLDPDAQRVIDPGLLTLAATLEEIDRIRIEP